MDAPSVRMNNELFLRLSTLIYDECGIHMPQSKKSILEARLLKRLRSIGHGSFDEYCSYLFSPEGIANELVNMIDVVTTNKTDFFREPQHFEYLLEHAVPTLVSQQGGGMRRTMMVWSAACSSGEEPYTIAMLLNEFSARARGFRYQVLATDISTRMLELARRAVYTDERIGPVPEPLRRKYIMRSRSGDGRVRIAPELRSQVCFRRINFMDDDFGFREKMDIIFCRNALIYFDRETQERVIKKLCEHLLPGGYLFTGHSESLHGMDVPLKIVANSVARKMA